MNAIEVAGVSKAYRVYQAPSDRLKEIVLRKSFHTDFFALRDVSMFVAPGETIGIIGENGAGKSTLLKILARTLKPTAGRVEVRGRSSALLELGAGFNPELTGEENIYLNGYLLGLSKEEIGRKRAAIVAFSEIGDFVKRPVKTYSSGMYVRLAFSIATSVDPDVLIIDEALSVGDLHFQKKSMDRMMDFRRAGKTIVFCSHSLYHIQELCTRTLWLKDGGIQAAGKTEKVIHEYQNYIRGKDERPVAETGETGMSPVAISEVSVRDTGGNPVTTIGTFQPLVLHVRLRVGAPSLKGHVGFALVRNDEEVCFATTTHYDSRGPVEYVDGMEIRVRFPALPVLNGIYLFRVSVGDETALLPYDTASTPFFSVFSERREVGMTFVEHAWEL